MPRGEFSSFQDLCGKSDRQIADSFSDVKKKTFLILSFSSNSSPKSFFLFQNHCGSIRTPQMRNSTPFSIFFLLLLSCVNSQSELYDQEHEVLLRMKQYFKNPSSLSHWTQSDSSSHCSWTEITCNNNSVTGLALKNISISQAIPTFICELKNLTSIDFQWNFIPGEFPTYLYNCSKLQYLDLSNNYFVGKVPEDIDRLGSLQFLNLGGNNFSAEIPVSITRLKQLTSLQLNQCLFNGTIPIEIGNLSNLEVLNLRLNSFSPSKLPSSFFTKLTKLKNIEMSDCNLIGEIPESIEKLVDLEMLDLSANQISGKIPSGIFLLKNLSIMFLSRNQLNGEIPQVIEALNLTIVDLARNKLTGKIPSGFGNLHKLTGLNFGVNQLSGEIPESLGRLQSIIDFGVIVNNLSGNIPSEFGLHSNLRRFELASNSFTGNLPQNLCYHGNLFRLTAYDNKLSGELPESLGNCSSLLELKVYNNEFSGEVPSKLWESKNLSTFMINDNKFTGELPENLPVNVSLMTISYNRFSGRIPKGISSMKNLVVFNASSNLFNGSFPIELTSLSQLATLLLDQNKLSGTFPSEILSWKSLRTLNLSQNQLSGEIPDSIGRLIDLAQLDLSENQFSGKIPSQLALLTPSVLNLSSNHFTGKIPSEFENLAYATSFLNNSGLCSDTAGLNLKFCNSVPRSSSDKGGSSSMSLGLIVGLAVVACIAIFFLSFLVMRFYQRRKQEFDTSWKLTSFQKLSFTESEIVSSMTEHNIIGRGGYGTVYRIAVNDKDDYVAVKKISNNRKLDHKLENAFLAEVEILGTIRHINIVKLLCCISNDDSLLLVYEYLEHRSLDKWLHKKNNGSSGLVSSTVHSVALDWQKRLRIAVGIAQGLSYMHHDNSPPIIHRDVKTSNILLDSQFNAKVADFGLARMLIKSEHDTMSAVVGSFGYIAPEYAQTKRVNEKVDVYSFGVILLELTTGKEANYGDEYSSLAEWAWRQIQLGNNVEQVLDEDVKETWNLDEMCSVFKLGVMCTSKEPAGRPTMKEVLNILLRLKEPVGYVEMMNFGHFEAVPLLKNSKKRE